MNPLSQNPMGQPFVPDSQFNVQVRPFFTSKELDPPFIPEKMMDKIEKVDADVYGTRKVDRSLYDVSHYIQEVLSGAVEPYVLFGLGGHGISSQGMHYYSVDDHLALFLQYSYGGAVDDMKFTKDKINGSFAGIEMLNQAISEAREKQLIQQNKRLLILESDFYGSGWGWIADYPGEINPKDWNTEDPIMLNALGAIPQ